MIYPDTKVISSWLQLISADLKRIADVLERLEESIK